MRASSFLITSSFFIFLFSGISILSFGQKTGVPLIVSGTVLLKEKNAPDSKVLINSLKTSWKLKVDSVNIGDKTLTFNTIGGVTVMIAYLDYPVAPDETGAAARLSWLWKTAATETSRHQAQLVISVIGTMNHSLDLHKIFTQTAAAAIEVTQSPGIYMDGQYLLLSGGYYSAAARNMIQNQTIPLYCWVYFGRPGDGNGFTYGLTEFGLPEMEITNAPHSEAEVHAALYDAAMTVVKYDTPLKDGQTLTTEEGVKMIAHLVNGTYLEEKKVLKLDY